MRVLVNIFLVISILYCVLCDASATESHGQEIIEIGPKGIKGLPPEIEEEPSAERDDDDEKEDVAVTAAVVQTATKKDTKTSQEPRRNLAKEAEMADEEDKKIEKELEEIYKDNNNNDYKDADEPKEKNKHKNKTALRTGSYLKFQPDLNNPKEIERFRTSVDDVTCSKGVTRLSSRVEGNGAFVVKSAVRTVLLVVFTVFTTTL